jgi:hypothetical protein
MAESSKSLELELEKLKTTVQTTSALIAQLSASAVPAKDATTSNVNVLDLAHDTASLIRAHATKLSLLIINKPFTASAINKVLRELVAGPLPGLASAVELCHATRYTNAVSAELQYRAGIIFQELGTFIKVIPLDGQILSDDAKNGTAKGKGKGSLVATGTLWEACDAVIELRNLGVAGVVIKKADEYRALLKDALEELQEWGEEESDGENDEDGFQSGDEADAAQAAVDMMFGSQRHIPSEDPDKIRPRLESSLKRLRLLILMYQAVVKRRFKTLPPLPPSEVTSGNSKPELDIVNSLDEVLKILKKIPDVTDELASSFYELDAIEIDKCMDQCFFTGFAVAELLIKNWEGKTDEFSNWVCGFPQTNRTLSLILHRHRSFSLL